MTFMMNENKNPSSTPMPDEKKEGENQTAPTPAEDTN